MLLDEPSPGKSTTEKLPPILRGALAEWAQIAEHWAAAKRRAQQAAVYAHAGEREKAEWEAAEALAELRAGEEQVADLFLLALRMAIKHRRDELGAYLSDPLSCEFEPLAEAVLELQEGCR